MEGAKYCSAQSIMGAFLGSLMEGWSALTLWENVASIINFHHQHWSLTVGLLCTVRDGNGRLLTCYIATRTQGPHLQYLHGFVWTCDRVDHTWARYVRLKCDKRGLLKIPSRLRSATGSA